MIKELIVFIILISMFSCANLNNKYLLFDMMKKEYLLEHLDDKKYINQWIQVKPVKIKQQTKYTEENLKEIRKTIQEYYHKAFFIGLVSLNSFKIYPYTTKDNEKIIEEKVDICKTFKGNSHKKITYKVSLEINDSYFPEDQTNKHIIFLFKKQSGVYLDPFLSFPYNDNVINILENINTQNR